MIVHEFGVKGKLYLDIFGISDLDQYSRYANE